MSNKLYPKPSRFAAILANTSILARYCTLLARLPADAQFRFDGSRLAKLKPTDLEAIEKIVERWESLPPAQRDLLGEKLAANLAARLGVDPPEPAKRLVFLEDLLASLYRREYRKLG